ncbi:MAG: hypothetical protein P9M11_00590 [Candidatus Tenebribacter burtonii]|jgi:hypothetical protein|nr:hypothetical protein [Candidatus Tenebribacter burtonii]
MNNNAAAVMLILKTFADGREVIISQMEIEESLLLSEFDHELSTNVKTN